MPSILTPEQARACANAMCALNPVRGRIDANLDNKIHVYEVANGLVFVASLLDSQIERYTGQPHFCDAHGLDMRQPVVKRAAGTV